jgi:hypothetical protein
MSKSPLISKIALLFVLLLYTLDTNAQLDGFNPSAYKVPDFRYRLLDLSFDISGNMQKSNNPSADQTANSFRPQFSLSHARYQNSRKKQRFSQSTFNSSSYLSNSTITQNTATESKQNTFNLDFYASGTEEAKYFNDNAFFIGYKLNAQVQLQINNNTSQIIDNSLVNQKTKNYQDNSQSDLGAAFTIGKGRIEETRYAMTAYYLLKDLYTKKLITQQPSHEQIMALAEKIGQILNRRTFDLRDKTIEELTLLDSTLSTMLSLPDKKIKYFTVLNDNWLFANAPSRKSGLSFQTDFEANLFSKSMFTQQTDLLFDSIASKFKDYTYGIGTGITFSLTYEKPISVKWQQSAKAYLTPAFVYQGNRFENKYNETSTEMQIPSIELGGGYTLGYYPNTRTYLTMGLDELIAYYQTIPDDSTTSHFSVNSRARIGLYYYFSPTLRLQAQAGFLLSHYSQSQETNNNTTKISNSGLNMGATLVYSIY